MLHSRRPIASILGLLLVLIGCSRQSGTGSEQAPTAAPDPDALARELIEAKVEEIRSAAEKEVRREPTPRPCKPPIEVGSATDVFGLAPEKWPRGLTQDLQATSELTLRSEDFPAPATAEHTELFGPVTLRVDRAVPGATYRSRSSVTIAKDATFRIQFIRLRGSGLLATLRIVAACRAEDCAEGQRRCGTDMRCYEDGEAYCNACDILSPIRCACAGPGDSHEPDGTDCSYFPNRGSHRGINGRCSAGICWNE